MMFFRKSNWHVVVDGVKQILAVYSDAQLGQAQSIASSLSSLGPHQVVTLTQKGAPRIGDTLT